MMKNEFVKKPAAKFSDPKVSLSQFITAPKAFVFTELFFSHIFAGVTFILLFTCIAVIVAFSLASATTGICMFGGLSPYMLIPEMPYWCGAILAVTLIALSVFTAVGCIYFTCLVRQLMWAHTRYCRNHLASAYGRAVLPTLVSFPRFSAESTRKLRKVSLISLSVFAVCFLSGYIVCAISTGTIGFWHEWNWFMK